MTRFLTSLLSIIFVFLLSLVLVKTTYAQALGELIIQPNGTPNGQSMTVDIMANSGSESVNAVQANILFPTSWSVRQIDTSNSAFGIQAENEAGNGIVKIARGTIQPVSGVQKVATITFNGSGSIGDIRISEDSAIIRSSDSKNIYSASQNYYANNSVTSETPVNTQDVTQTQPDTSEAPAEEKGFFAKLMAWNNAFWDKIIGLFSKN